jgi:hypothetical protein
MSDWHMLEEGVGLLTLNLKSQLQVKHCWLFFLRAAGSWSVWSQTTLVLSTHVVWITGHVFPHPLAGLLKKDSVSQIIRLQLKFMPL